MEELMHHLKLDMDMDMGHLLSTEKVKDFIQLIFTSFINYFISIIKI